MSIEKIGKNIGKKVAISLSAFASLFYPLAYPVRAEPTDQRADYSAWLVNHQYWRVQHPDFVQPMIYDMPIGKSPVIGPVDAKVTIVEFVDFSDSYSRQLAQTCRALLKHYPGKIRIVFKNAPSTYRSNSLIEHQLAMAALLQNKFWPMYDKLFFDGDAQKREEATYLRWAKELGLDVNKFQLDRKSKAVAALIEQDLKDANGSMMSGGAPKFFLNGRRVTSPRSADEIQRGVEFEMWQ